MTRGGTKLKEAFKGMRVDDDLNVRWARMKLAAHGSMTKTTATAIYIALGFSSLDNEIESTHI